MKKQKFTEDDILNLARNAYENGEANFEIKSEKCALLVIDMQDEFVKPNWTPYWVPEATKQVSKIKILIEHCRNKKITIIYTMFSKTNNYFDRPNSGKYMPNRFPDLDIDQSEYFSEGRIFEEVAPKANDIVIHKPSYGAFYDTPLETILRNIGKDTVIICGTLTNYCCGTTARQAYERGFKVIFGSDVTSTDDQTMQEPELKVLRKGFAKVLNLNKILEAI
jgi:nicotinamidase-related amidase